MRALVAHAAKDLRLEEHTARSPQAGEVLVKIVRGGICGSDLHYFNHGGFGDVKLREPMILGHEVAGVVQECGANVNGLNIGQLVAVSPSRPCRQCTYCLQGVPNHCLNMRFYGSAMPFPHIQGAFREYLTVDASQCAIADGLEPHEAAMAEPLAVAIHATQCAGSLTGKRVLVTGCGPIGLLCIIAALRSGAVEIVATDIADYPLQKAQAIGADTTINVTSATQPLADFTADKGYFDVLFECSGVASAPSAAIPAMRPGSIIVQLGLGGDMTLPVQQMTAKEIQLRGSFRFHDEFFTGIEWMRSKRVNVTPLVTNTMPLSDFNDAFNLACDRTQAIKVQLDMQ